MIALQLPWTLIISSSMYFFFFLCKSFKSLAYASICCIVLEKRIFLSNYLKISMKQENCFSLSFLEGTRGYGRTFCTFSSFLLSISPSLFHYLFFFLSILILSIIILFLSFFSLFFLIHVPTSRYDSIKMLFLVHLCIGCKSFVKFLLYLFRQLTLLCFYITNRGFRAFVI